MYSNFNVKITPKTLKRYFIMKIFDKNQDFLYNKNNLSVILDEYHCSENEKDKMYTWFNNCWSSGIWEE